MRTGYLFVYGTLKRGGCREQFLRGAHFCGLAVTSPGYALFELDGYPGLIERAAGGCIAGELYRIDDRAFGVLDKVEGVADGWFGRGPIRLQAPHSDFCVDAYFYLGNVVGRRQVFRRWPAG